MLSKGECRLCVPLAKLRLLIIEFCLLTQGKDNKDMATAVKRKEVK